MEARAAPAAVVLGHGGDASQNDGFLSRGHGFLPVRPPVTELGRSHRAWDEIAIQLPELYRGRGVRAAVEGLPLLGAGADELADELLWRAATVIGVLAHAYVRSESNPAPPLPPPLQVPWKQIAQRLGRERPFLAYDDLIAANWRRAAGQPGDPLRVEDLRLLVATVDNQAEQIFYLTQVEMLSRAAPAIGAAADAQEAATARDVERLTGALVTMIDVARSMTDGFSKISPNEHAATYVDPVLWATTVAPFAAPLDPGGPGPSGLAAPPFHLFDVFLQRATYESGLGVEAGRLRSAMPPRQRQFLDAVAAVSVPDLVARSGDRQLAGLLRELSEAFAGEQGCLGVHRRKVYGYLAIAFKVGRQLTVRGFSDELDDRGWKEVDAELELARGERELNPMALVSKAAVVAREHAAGPQSTVTRVTIRIGGSGLRYRPGDRLRVLARNDPQVVDRAVAALGAAGVERVPLTRAWRAAVAQRGEPPSDSLDLRTFLCWGKLRPVTRQVATALHAVTGSAELRRILAAYEEDQWELPELLDLLAVNGYDTTRLWRSALFQPEALARVVPPEGLREYSISVAPPAQRFPGTVELTVQPLLYEAVRPLSQAGTASSFIAGRAALGAEDLLVDIGRARSFRPPEDPRVPVVLLAGGSGIAPFLAFAESRAAHADGTTWLLCGARTEQDVVARERLGALAATGRVDVSVVLSRQDAQLQSAPEGLVLHTARRGHVPDLVRSPAVAARLRTLATAGAFFYVCGQPAFASSVRDALGSVLGTPTLRRLSAERQFVEEVFTPFAPAHPAELPLLDASEVSLHNDDDRGRWMVISGGVYDVSQLRHLHPGGHRIVDESCGTDATAEWEAVGHHDASDVAALLATYRIGTIRRLDFGGSWAIALTPAGPLDLRLGELFSAWVRYLYALAEMENGVRNDYAHLELSLVRGQRPGEPSPFGSMLAENTHRRFLQRYFPAAAGRRLDELWRLTVGFIAAEERSGWMAESVADAHARIEASVLADSRGTLDGHDLRRRDLELLSALKTCARAGVVQFERHEQLVVERSGASLLETLRGIPQVIASYCEGAVAPGR